jgi:translocation and assembly module TamA
MKTKTFTAAQLFFLTIFVLFACAEAVWAESSSQIRIDGVDGDALVNVTEALRPPEGLFHDGGTNSLWLNRYIRLAPERVSRALEPFGYYSPTVNVQVDQQVQPSMIKVEVNPGEPVRVESLNLELIGDQLSELQKLIDSFPLSTGSILLHLPYEQFKAELQAEAVDLGYLDAGYSRRQIRVNRETRTAQISLALKLGPRYRFGNVRFDGGDNYPERFLRRYLVMDPGEQFSYMDLGKSQQRLLDSDRFSSVVIVPLREESEDDAVPIEVRLKEKAPKRLRPGIGYGTDNGARFFTRYQDVNVWHLGHEFTTDLLIAERQQNLVTNYLFPGYRNLDTMLALRGGYTAESLETYDSSSLFTEIEQLYGFRNQRVGSVYIRFQREESTISGDKLTTLMLMPGVRFRLGRLDDPARPRAGYKLSVEVRGASAKLVSDVSLLQIFGDMNWISPLPWRLYLHLRGKAAYSVQNNDIDTVPASLRFFAGGDQSVRGYAYQSLGPTNAAGEVIGGKHLLVGSLELEKRFFDNWGGTIFYDAGNAFNNFSDYELAKAAGVGLRYYTVIGPASIDLARTIGTDKVNYRVHIGLGVGW